MGRRIAVLVVALGLSSGAGAAWGLRGDLLLHGVVCVARSSVPDGEGARVIACADGRRWRTLAQLPCSETLSCRIGIDCIDSIEPLR